MIVNRKCIIDNWSLEHAGFLLDNSKDYQNVSDEVFKKNLFGLSNYINALLFYEDTNFLINGFEKHWTRFEWFERNTRLYIKGLDSSKSNIDWESPASYSDNGISNYLLTSKIFNSDLIISPERSSKLIKSDLLKAKSGFLETLEKIDKTIQEKNERLWYENIKVGIEHNFKFPSLTHYVLSQATNSEDLLTVIMQLKTDRKIIRIKEKIDEISNSTKSSVKFQKEIENIISQSFGEKLEKDNPWSISLSILFLSLSKSFNISFFNIKEHIIFLKDLIAARAEAMSLQKDIQRVFKRKISDC